MSLVVLKFEIREKNYISPHPLTPSLGGKGKFTILQEMVMVRLKRFFILLMSQSD